MFRVSLAIRLPEEIEARLEILAKRTGHSKKFHAREAILTHLEDLAEIYLAGQVVQRIEVVGFGVTSAEVTVIT